MGTSWWSADDWRRKAWAIYQEPWPGESRAGSAPTGTPDQAEQGETNLRRTPLAVNAGVPRRREVSQGVGEGCCHSLLSLRFGNARA